MERLKYKFIEKLFSENFNAIQNQEEFDRLKEKYSNFHPSYLKIAASVYEIKIKNWIENLFSQYYPHINGNFLDEIKPKKNFITVLGKCF